VATTDKIIFSGDVYGVFSSNSKVGACLRSSMINGQSISCPEFAPSTVHYWDVKQLPGGASSDGLLIAANNQDVNLLDVKGLPPNGVSVTETDTGTFGFNPTFDTNIPGGQIGGGYLDDRIVSATQQVDGFNGKLMVTFASTQGSCGQSGNDCAVIGGIQIVNGTASIIQSYVVTETGWNYIYPAVTKDAYGDIFVAFSRSNASTTPMAVELSINPTNGGYGFDQIIYGNVANTNACGGGTCNERWGDYAGAVQDPDDHTKVWVASEYQAASGEFGWDTVVALATFTGTLCC
jgi:hypothetical protein